MALKPCKECKRNVAVGAKSCPHCGVAWPAGRKTSVLAWGGLGLIVFVIVVSVANSGSNATRIAPPSGTASDRLQGLSVEQLKALVADSPTNTRAAARLAVLLANTDSARQVRRARDGKELAALLRRFTFKKDEVRGSGWFTPLSQSAGRSWNRSFLGAIVASDGTIWLQSHYHGETWIFHDRVAVRLGDRMIQAGPQPRARIDHTNTDVVWEVVSYQSGEDNGLLQALAEAPPGTPVIVQLENDKTYIRANYTEADRQAIHDSWRLSQLAKEFGEAALISMTGPNH